MAQTNSEKRVIFIPLLISVVLVAVGMLIGDVPILGNLVMISIFLCVTPYFIYKYMQFLKIKSLEEQFPNFVRDLADSSRTGMSLPESIGIAAKANYGKLSPEIHSMHDRLSWGTPFLRVLDIFQKAVKDSKVINEALIIIRQSFETGGSIPDTLDAVARDMIMLKEAESERASVVREQVMIMYGLFFIFLGISVMIVYVMVPMLQSQASAVGLGATGFAFVDPCESGIIFPCGFFAGLCAVFDIGAGMTCYYVAVFFSVVLVQGICTGLIAGQLSQNSTVSGVKHSLIMCFSAVMLFLFLTKTGWFPI